MIEAYGNIFNLYECIIEADGYRINDDGCKFEFEKLRMN